MAFEMKDLGPQRKFLKWRLQEIGPIENSFSHKRSLLERLFSDLAWRKRRLFELLLQRILSFWPL
jgi:hypothetical protein